MLHPAEPSRGLGAPRTPASRACTSPAVCSRASVLFRWSLQRSYFSLNFLSDFIEKNSGLGAFRHLCPRLPLGQKHLFTRCPVSTRWGPVLRTWKEATGGPASAPEPRRTRSATHCSRARSPRLCTRTARSRARPRPPARAPRPPNPGPREPLPQGRGVGAGWQRGQGDTQKRAGTGLWRRRHSRGASARLLGCRGRGGRRVGGQSRGACGSRLSGMGRWGPGEGRGRASPAA